MRNPSDPKKTKPDQLKRESIESLLSAKTEAGASSEEEEISSHDGLEDLDYLLGLGDLRGFLKKASKEDKVRNVLGVNQFGPKKSKQFKSTDGASVQSDWMEDKRIILEKLNLSQTFLHKSIHLKQQKIDIEKEIKIFPNAVKRMDEDEITARFERAIRKDDQANEIKRLIGICESENKLDFKKNFPRVGEYIKFLDNLIEEKNSEIVKNTQEFSKLEASLIIKLNAKREAEEQAKREVEAKAQKEFAKQQRRAEYLEKINLEKVDGIISEAISKIEDGIVNELASKFVAEEVSKLEEEDRIKSKTVADAVDRIENKIIDELLPEFVNEVVDKLLPEFVNEVVDELVNEVVNEALDKIVAESFAEAKTEEKTKIEAEERSRLKDQIRAEIESEVREEIEARLRGEIEARVREELKVAHKNEITELKARFDSDIKILNDRFRKEMETAQNEFKHKAQNQSGMRVKNDRIKSTPENEKKLKELEDAHKIDLERKLKELETKLQIKYEKLFNKKILEEREMHANKLEKISKVLKDEIKEGPKQDKKEKKLFQPNPNDLSPLAQAPQLGLAVKKTDKAKISELNSAKQIQDFLDDNPKDKIKKLTREFYDENSHELIFKIITNAEITSSEKIQKLNIVKAITSEESWKEVVNKRKEDLTLFETAILSGDSILAEYFISNNKKIDESNVCNAIYFLSLSDKIEKNNKLEILTKILDLTSEKELDEILNKKSNSNNTLLDYASKCDENFILKLTQKGARLRDCKKLHEFINYAFNSDNFGKFVDNAKKNGEENIFGTINSDCQNLFHHLSNNKFSLTSEQISEKFEKLYLAMDREQFLNSINQLDNKGFSPLDLAIKNNNTEFALELVKKGANKNYILHELYSAKNYDMMEVFYEKGPIKFTEFPEKIIENLLETIRNNPDRAGIDINDKFLNFIQDNLAREKLKKVEKIAEEKLSQPSPAIQQKSSSSLDPQEQNRGLKK